MFGDLSLISDEVRGLIARVDLVVFDFDGVFTDNAVYVSQDGVESVRCSRSDGIGLRKLDRLGVDNMVLSTETKPGCFETVREAQDRLHPGQ